ncbi:alpha/beta fold hydrolase [Comamonas composti]|uniref:alpha/beta fold hydrolase n=1 Tax=Comamonas composti TaxID=408558 RepID=UPI000417ED25|nr:alpha/beta hydrolase [Comamonas composti]
MACWEWNNTGDPAHPHVIVCVHGLSRQGRDFDVLAQDLSRSARVICPDVIGRGESDWLQDPSAYQLPVYAADMLALLTLVHAQGEITRLDWIGTSMGGLVGMALAGQPGLPLPRPISRLVLNDVGPAIEWSALQRIQGYLGKNLHFPDAEQAAAELYLISQGFGPHDQRQWSALTAPMLRPAGDGGVQLHYDPAIAEPMAQMTQEQAQAGEALLWQLYAQIKARVLLVRGAQSDLLSAATAKAMGEQGPKAHCVEFEGVGHAPTFVAAGQVALLRKFLWGDECLPSTLSLAEQTGRATA